MLSIGFVLLSFSEVDYRYSSRIIFRRLSLDISAAKTVITGPNGCGKTTLLMLAAGILSPQQGHINFNLHNIIEPSNKHKIGISASRVALPDFMSVQEFLSFHSAQFNCSGAQTWLEKFNLDKFASTQVSALSLGNYKKLSLIAALMHEPELLLLDEPTNGLDDKGLQALADVLEDYSGQMIIASHDANSELLSGMFELPVAELTELI